VTKRRKPLTARSILDKLRRGEFSAWIDKPLGKNARLFWYDDGRFMHRNIPWKVFFQLIDRKRISPRSLVYRYGGYRFNSA